MILELKKGIVLKIKKRVAYLLTDSGEIVLVKIYDLPPNLGDLYESKEVKPSIFSKIHLNFKHIFLAFVVTLILSASIGAVLYFTPVTTVSINEYSSILIKSNRFNKVISVTTNNEQGKKIIHAVNINNKNLSTALQNIYSTSVDLGILDDDFATYKRIYSVKITSKQKVLDLTDYIEFLKTSPYVIQVSKDGYDLLNTISL